MSRAWRLITSLKLSAIIIAVLATLLLLGVALPQEHLVGREGVEAITSGSPIKRFLLVTLGFSSMPSSPIFLGVLALFFGNLAAVMLERSRSILKRIEPRSPSASSLRRRAEKPEALRRPRPPGFQPAQAKTALRRLGYEVSSIADDCVFAEKNRRGLLGFLLFHLAFFPILAGGLMLYYTRFEASARLTEGQSYDRGTAWIQRHAPLGDPDELVFRVEAIAPELEDGKPIQLRADLAIGDGPGESHHVSEVNDPASTGHIDILVTNVGLSAVVRILDRDGRTVDLVAVAIPTKPNDFTLSSFLDDELEIELAAVPLDPDFPSRPRLRDTAVRLRFFEGEREVFSGALRPGEIARGRDYSVKLDDLRYWAQFRIVAERGGWLLILGFAIAVIGLVWRMLFVRREVSVVWYDDAVVFFGRAEFYRGRFKDELEAIATFLLDRHDGAAIDGEEEIQP